MRAIRFLLLLLLPAPLLAVTLTVGNDVAAPNASDSALGGATRTDIDLVHPASHSGSVNLAKVYWATSGCTNAFKIKFFRRVGDTLTMVAERGPFSATSNLNTVALSPSVSLKQGDLIGVARVAPCGNAGALTAFPSEGYLQYAGDVTGSVDIAAATAGAFGSQFKTEMQFFNPQTSGSMTVKLVYHPMGVAGSSSDPTRLVILDPGEVFSTADVVAAMGQSGVGSLDVSVPAGQSVPMLLTRVYNDAGNAGMSSLTEEAVEVSNAVTTGTNVLARGVTAFLITPRDPLRTRFNIGVRTLFSGASVQVTVRDASGTTVRTATRTYTANYFIQTDAASFVGGPIGPDQTIQISVSSGSAIVYGSTTDNTTNDPNVQFAYGIFAIA